MILSPHLIMTSYWDFLQRKPPTANSMSGIEFYPLFYKDAALWSLFFTILYGLTYFGVRVIFPKIYANLSKRKQRELPCYIVCFFHHLIRVPDAWYHIYIDYNRTDLQLINYASEVIIGPFTIGYFVCDLLWYAFPEAREGKFEYIIHHAFTLFVIIAALYQDGNMLRFTPHLVILDTPNLFFNFAWVLRALGLTQSSIVLISELLFTLFYFLIRLIHFPCFLYVVANSEYCQTYWKYAQYPFYVLVIMQFYWFTKIFSNAMKRFSSTKNIKKQ